MQNGVSDLMYLSSTIFVKCQMPYSCSVADMLDFNAVGQSAAQVDNQYIRKSAVLH